MFYVFVLFSWQTHARCIAKMEEYAEEANGKDAENPRWRKLRFGTYMLN